ncbi:anti-sigma factor family protein [Bacillus sp. 179-C3.3 HS]|uniref:anti-sigma factor family protein n=1 Tax=Bacillus sp. 179-C3.3 HS TaxID=3232162 RepID=UPI0039A2DF2C
MSCYLVKELLPLYIEGDCSADTNQFMTKHLHSCEECHQLYHEMKEPIPFIKTTDDMMILSMDEDEEKRKFEKRYYGKLLVRACFVFGIVYVLMIILYWFK